jgi:2-C-methyl-D-erythritol 4-phosphate cytidylyltransferase
LVISAIITAAGSGNRFGEIKQFKLLEGQPLYQYSLKVFLSVNTFDEIILVVPKGSQDTIKQEIKKISDKPVKIIVGGINRQDSVKNGIQASSVNADLVVIHDAVRPFVTKELIANCISACSCSDGAIIAVQSVDTIKYSKDDTIEKTINREFIWMAQTPQVFNKAKLLKAYKNHSLDNSFVTDESSIMENMGYSITIVPGVENNFKVTTIEDWNRAEVQLR